ncbi:transcriptional antiterminator [Halobacteroides halobius DSM 5150]|uniref:Transcriptional antiterminator n=1 Tax=Halobacteroides halobius (strain ATCC 35273 / DSM 5150 / MD-1) TaxID=748449 RepID=L0KBE2_HALHC|nr:transcription antiterminator [Halobacteroides halobius]AGB41403.1 transcriptional antiterminator [Halobacteroides halobius DSM 5150]
MAKLGKEDYQYLVKKVFNNNVILATKKANNKHEEVVLVGRGLGFSKSEGDIISKAEVEVEKEFVPADKEKKETYQQLVAEVDEEVIGLTEEIIAMVSSQIEEELDKHIHIALADHICFALKRIKDGAKITNPFLHEIKTLYNEEYKLAQKAAKIIKDRTNISIPEGEIGFITLHIHGARENRGMTKTVEYTSLIKSMVERVKEELDIEISYESLNYARLVTHLRFALERIEQDEVNKNPFLDDIKNNFKGSYQLAAKLTQLIEDKFEYQVPEDEIGYLAMHLQRLRKDLI